MEASAITTPARKTGVVALSEDTALWYKDAIIYQVHIKSFADGNGDGMGDFKGLISRLDYLEDLGVTAIWVLPFYPSPLRDDGYDIADYTAVNSDYGTLADFRRFLKEAHARGMKVITELVLNHTSDQHAWFQRARRAKKGSVYRDFYVWSDKPDKYLDARIIFQDFEHSNWSYDVDAGAYYWHRFYSHQPDLNFENPRVHQALFKVLDFWFSMGVDGMRLDAVPYLYEAEGTNCENLPPTYEFLKKLRAHVDANHKGKMLLAEANQWPEDAVDYFGDDGNACHMAFHFPLMPRMYMALEMENRYPVIDILEQTPTIPETCQWALFLRNHDELTLEMVTDEERDYMYRIYAKDPRARINLGIRRRLAPLLDNDPRKIRLMNVLLMSLPGSPVVYYGDEIGMGDNYYLGDRDGVRTPMQWSSDKNAGFSKANPQKLYLPVVIDPEYHYEAVNVETQESRGSSLLWWMRHLIGLRKRHKAFGRGSIEFLHPENVKVLAFTRTLDGETILVVANISRHAQMVDLDLSDYPGYEPEDMFSRSRFKPVGEDNYTLTLGPFGYYMFQLHAPEAPDGEVMEGLPRLSARSFESLFASRENMAALEDEILPSFMRGQRWFGGKARSFREVRVLERIPITRTSDGPLILLVEVNYTEGDPEIYIVPLAYAPVEDRETYQIPKGAMAWATFKKSEGAVYEAVHSSRFLRGLLDTMAGRKRLSASHGKLQASAGRYLTKLWRQEEVDLEPRLMSAEQSNTSILYGRELILKIYRRTEKGIHPDLEIARFLTDRAGFRHTPPYAGALEYKLPDGQEIVLGLLQEFIPNQGDAWEHMLGLVGRFYERVLAMGGEDLRPPKAPAGLLAAAESAELPAPMDELLAGVTLEAAELLGRRTAEMHLALARGQGPGFRPDKFSTLYQRALFQSMHNQVSSEMRFMRKNRKKLSDPVREEAEAVLSREKAIVSRMRGISSRKIQAQKIRIHGDFHLGQVLYTGKDFVIFDFEGEPSRPLSERRLKRSPMRDVAGMIRSCHYAAYAGLLRESSLRESDKAHLEPWAELWYQFVSGAYLRGYLDAMKGSPVIPEDRTQLENMLVPFMLHKAVYEMGYELNNRPDWLIIPLRGINYLCGE